jgi:hypothetical protein
MTLFIQKEHTMNVFKKMVVLATLVAMIGTSAPDLAADEGFSDTGEFGYEQSRGVSNLAPAIALGTIAIVAIIAVAAQSNRHHHHGQGHGHSHAHN